MSNIIKIPASLEIPLIFDSRHYCVDDLKNKMLLHDVRDVCSAFGHNTHISDSGCRGYGKLFKKFYKNEVDFFVSIYSFIRIPVYDPETFSFARISLEDQKYFYIDRLLRKHTKRAENCGVQGFNKTLFFIYGEKSLMLMPLKKAFENNGFIKNSALHYKIINQRSDLITAIVVSTIGELQNGYYPIKTEDVLSDIEIIDFILQFKGEQQPGTESLEAKYIETIKRCANDNLPDAVFLLGYCYFSGKGIPVNLELALKLIKKAAKNGSLPAIEFLSSLGLDENE